MADYPSDLPDFRIGKKKKIRDTFKVIKPLQGLPYHESVTQDEPWIIDVQITCSSLAQAKKFIEWVKTVSRGETFEKNILTENGFEKFSVGWLELPKSPTQVAVNIFTYSGTIYAKQLDPIA